MLCGYLKQTCKSITVQQLIDILNTCKNKNSAVVKLSEMTNFFIHFDKDGQFVDFSKSPMTKNYGENPEKGCQTCNRYDHVINQCKCDGKNCLNAECIINDLNILNKIKANLIDGNEVTKAEEQPNVISSEQPAKSESDSYIAKYDLSKYTINGIGNTNDKLKETTTPSSTVLKQKNEEEQQKPTTKIPSDTIQNAVDDAIIKALNKMINGIKETNK